jgi:RecA-family ATPase
MTSQDQFRPGPEAIGDYLRYYVADTPFIVDCLVKAGSVSVLFGPPGVWKSFLATELAMCLADGTEWLGFRVSKSKVWIINTELPDAEWKSRWQDIQMARKFYEGVDIKELNVVLESRTDFYLDSPLGADYVIKQARAQGVKVLIVDNLYSSFMGNLSSNQDQQRMINYLNEFKKQQLAVVLVAHVHQPKTDGGGRVIGEGLWAMYGGTFLSNYMDTIVSVGNSKDKGGNSDSITLTTEKHRLSKVSVPRLKLRFNRKTYKFEHDFSMEVVV